jgi:DNA-binding NtrC family response regulator
VIVCDTENFFVDKSWLASEYTQPQISEKTLPQEKEMICAALTESRGRISGPVGAAAKLGMPASTLESKIKTLKIDKYRFKSV